MRSSSSSQVTSAKTVASWKSDGRLVERRLLEDEFVAVVEAHELARDDHDRHDEHRAGTEPIIADDDDGEVQGEEGRDAVGGREQ